MSQKRKILTFLENEPPKFDFFYCYKKWVVVSPLYKTVMPKFFYMKSYDPRNNKSLDFLTFLKFFDVSRKRPGKSGGFDFNFKK